jgi:hypothetical protein
MLVSAVILVILSQFTFKLVDMQKKADEAHARMDRERSDIS